MWLQEFTQGLAMVLVHQILCVTWGDTQVLRIFYPRAIIVGSWDWAPKTPRIFQRAEFKMGTQINNLAATRRKNKKGPRIDDEETSQSQMRGSHSLVVRAGWARGSRHGHTAGIATRVLTSKNILPQLKSPSQMSWCARSLGTAGLGCSPLLENARPEGIWDGKGISWKNRTVALS